MAPKPLAIDGVFDIETAEWDHYVLGGLRLADGTYDEFRDPDDLFKALCKQGGQIWAHNGGRFDFLWFLEAARRARRAVTATVAGSRIVSLTCGHLTLRDSFALAPVSLRELATFGDVGQKGDWDHSRTHKRMSHAELVSLGEYLRQDCEVLYSALRGFFRVGDELGMVLRPTIGATAWKTAAKMLGLDEEPLSPHHYHGARAGYYGGRVQVFRPLADAGHRMDINSAYPYALATTPLPWGERYYLTGTRARMAYANEKEGIYVARIVVPLGSAIPPLPVRLPSGGRLAYPVGPIAGTWAGNEIRAAEEAGCKVEVQGGWVFEDVHRPFEPFVRHFWDWRKRVGKHTGQGICCKFLINSLTGKLAQSPDVETVHLFPDSDRIVVCPGSAAGDCEGYHPPPSRSGRPGKCCAHRCTGWCRSWSALGASLAIWSAPGWRIPGNARPELAAYLTAATRIRLRQQLVADGRDGRTAIYCDTDSCYSTTRRRGPEGTEGKELGQWAYEGRLRNWVALAPKAYQYEDPDAPRGERVVSRCKGLPALTPARFAQYSKGVVVPIRHGVKTLKTAVRGDKLFERGCVARASRGDGVWFGDRKLGDDGLTHPQTMDTLIRHEQESKR